MISDAAKQWIADHPGQLDDGIDQLLTALSVTEAHLFVLRGEVRQVIRHIESFKGYKSAGGFKGFLRIANALQRALDRAQ